MYAAVAQIWSAPSEVSTTTSILFDVRWRAAGLRRAGILIETFTYVGMVAY